MSLSDLPVVTLFSLKVAWSGKSLILPTIFLNYSPPPLNMWSPFGNERYGRIRGVALMRDKLPSSIHIL